MARKPRLDRRTRILDAAERTFADFGFDGASLRRIVAQAGVNLATVYYYFGSKEGLVEAVLERRFGPLRQEHLAALKHSEAQVGAAGAPLGVEGIVEAMILPPLRLAGADSERNRAVTRLIGRLVTEPNPHIQSHLRKRHHDVRSAFLRALCLALPHIPRADLMWRLEFIWGALALMLCNPGKLEAVTRGECDPADREIVAAQMIRFFSAGLVAPGVECPKPEKPA